MKRRVAFRSFVILLAAVMLLSSTSAYNILVYANQDSVANSLSAIESSSDAAATEPNIAVQGGELVLNAETDDSTATEQDVSWVGDGSEQNPYQISSAAHLLDVNNLVNGIKSVVDPTQKHFVLTADIDLAEWFALHNDDINSPPYVNVAASAFLVSTNASDVNKYIILDGSYKDENDVERKHKIYISDTTTVDVKNYQDFALFGYLSRKSVISNIIFENINVNVTSLDAQRISIISYQNDGVIKDCELVDCSVSLKSEKQSVNGAGSATAYYGVAGVVADNRNNISGVKLSNFTLTLGANDTNDYIGGVVGQNRGEITDTSVSGIKMTVSADNHYVGALAGYNAATVKNSSVEMAGSKNFSNNIQGGGYVGGLVGYNDAAASICNSSVTGTFTSAQSTAASAYNMYGKAETNNSTAAYFGGITGVNKGTVEKTTVSNLGFYMAFASISYTGYFGGIAAVTTDGKISASVASGTFVSANSAVCYAGGIIAYAEADEKETVSDCYALFKLNVPYANSNAGMVGAIVGYGGTADTAVNSYWSDAISGCVTSYVIPNADKPASIEANKGKLVSGNRAVTVIKGGKETVSSSEITHIFKKIDGASISPATVSVTENVDVNGSGINNSLTQKAYKAVFSFPTEVGASDKQSLEVGINLDVLVTSASGDPDSIENPLVISSSAMAKFLYLAPYGHYALSTDIAVLSDSWSASNFTGTLNGNGRLISTDTSIFKTVIGTRNKLPALVDFVSYPAEDEADRTGGLVENLTVELSDNIVSAVFGTVYNATFLNTALTDGDPTPDDGNDNSYEGYIADISKSYTAAFIDSAVGYSYIYGCSSDVSVKMADVADIAGFIAYLSGNVVVDNCAVTNVGAYIGTDNSTEKAVFLGNVSTNSGGSVLNSIVSARVIGTGKCYLVMGANQNQFSDRYKNITWSKMNYASTAIDSSMNTADIPLWGSNDKTYSSVVKSVTAASSSVYSIAIPKNVSAFADAGVEDFAVSLVNINSDGSETQADASDFSLGEIKVENGAIVLNISVSASAQDGSNVVVKVFHYDTGFVTYVKYQVITESFERGEDGFYHISSPADLIKFSELCNDANNGNYLTYAYKLDNDIDMSGYEYSPAATGNPFVGYFDGCGKTISNLTITGSGNVAFIATAVSGGNVTVTDEGTKNTTVLESGIFNVNFKNVNVSATQENTNAAVLLAKAAPVTSSDTAYAKIKIDNISITDSTVISAGKNTAAVLADAVNCDVEINNVTINNTTVQTEYSENKFFNSIGTAIGGLGGIIATVNDTVNNPAQSHIVSVTDIDIDGLVLTGLTENEKSYAGVNAGAVIGTYQKYHNIKGKNIPKLYIGNDTVENNYDVVINNIEIMSAGMAGGAVGSTNAQTDINKVKVSSTGDSRSELSSTTEYFIGGIAGYIGSYDADNETDEFAMANMFGTISDCLVENTDIKATNPEISKETNSLTRNVAVGGIVGAINGPADANTVENCTVSNTLVEGVVVGGIVGSNIERTVAVGNVLHISYCDVNSTTIKTLDKDKCYPVSYKQGTGTGVNNYAGVGGILGTNVTSKEKYVADVIIEYCNIDSNSNIYNYIPATYNTSVYAQSATGGILGSGFQLRAHDGQLVLKNNTASASVLSVANMGVSGCWNTFVTQYNNKLRVGTGGFIGMLSGFSNSNNVATAVDLLKIHILDSVFDGIIEGTDCIGGVIGSVVSASGAENTTATGANNVPSDLIKNIVLSGKLNSSLDNSYYRGGVVIGSILILAAPPSVLASASISCYNGQVDMTQTFSGIYFSSLEIDLNVFPVFSCVGANPSTNSVGVPTISTTKGYLKNCYIDVNSIAEDNTTPQLEDRNDVSSQFIISDSDAPEANRGMFTLESVAALNNTQSRWKSSNSSVAAVSDTTYETVTVTPKSKSDNAVIISIDYLGVMTSEEDPSWVVPVSLPVGFRLYSTADKVLDYIVDNGKTYYLLSEPIDFNYIETNKNYWLKNDIEFTSDLYETDGTFEGGYVSKGTESSPFNGEFASIPANVTFTVHTANGTDSYTSTKETLTISGLQYALVTGGTYSAAALFAYAENAKFSNFKLSDVTSTQAVDYAAAVVAVVKGTLTADGVTVENANISGAAYSGGLFGGMFGGNDTVETPWQVTDCTLSGTRSGNGESTTYSTNISGIKGAAGIAVHTDQNAASFSGITVSGSKISQTATEMDSSYYDNGAAGISLAYSGEISASNVKRNLIENSYIVGEIAAGAVVRTYTSANATSFASAGVGAQIYSVSGLTISGVDIKASTIEGNHTDKPSSAFNKLIASGGILARVDSSNVKHSVFDCLLDESTVVKAPYSVGGILGCFEEPKITDTADAINSKKYGIAINDCIVQASVEMTGETVIVGSDNYYNMGVGGVIGAFSAYSGFANTNVKNCEVTGLIKGSSAVGGIIGAIWTNYASAAPNTFRLDLMDSHFIENCVISADFCATDNSEAFSSANSTTGIVVGYVLNASSSTNDTIFRVAANNFDKNSFSNQPFYNIYYSGYKYPSDATYLFGVIRPGTNTSQKSLNYSSSYDYSCYTDYIYDMDYYTGVPCVIDKTDHNVVMGDNYRVQQTESEENGIWVLDNRDIGTGFRFNLSKFTFNTKPNEADSENSELTYRFDNEATLNGFTLSASAGSMQTTTAVLEKVTADNSNVKITKGEAEGEYVLSTVNTPTKTLAFNLVFVYSNGIELVAPFRIEVSDGDYYFVENNSKGGTDYYVFNASNLNSTLQLTLGENDNVFQCFDVFWTADKQGVIDAVNAYTAETTLATVLGEAHVAALENAKHLNPEYDPELNNAEYLSISDYLGLADGEALGDVALRRLVKELNTVSYGTYGDEGDAAIYDKEFKGTYTVLTADGDTGLTAAGEYYSIYGLEIHAVNTSAQKSDATHTGLFASLGSGASITGVTFVNPKIEVVGAKSEDNYAGVLAGASNGAAIKDVTVKRYSEGDTAYVSSIRWMTAANTKVGGIVGYADSATTLSGCSVNGLDVVAASLAGNVSGQLKTVMAGGIAGSSDASISDSSVSNSRILVERNDRYRNFYLSYAGGIAACATNTISNVEVINSVLRDCTCDVFADDEASYSTYSVAENTLVADRIGGVAAYTDGSVSIADANVQGITVRAFDIAGGVLGAVESNKEAVVSVENSSVGDYIVTDETAKDDGSVEETQTAFESDIRIYSSANIASATSLRQYYNAVGGVVGKIGELASLSVKSTDFDGYAGTYSYDNLNKDCTAGGIIGFVTDELSTLDAVTVYDSTVSGEITGYRSGKTDSMVPYLGAAGGIIGKINTVAVKINTESSMVSDCVMGAQVNLYSNTSGALVNASLADPAASPSTNVGKLLGTLVSAVVDEESNTVTSKNFAIVEGEKTDGGNFGIYFKNIYVSSYPQDIIAYGSRDFYGTQYSPFTTYTDINKVVLDEKTGETEGALMIGSLELAEDTTPDYAGDAYSDLAIIPIDTDNPDVEGTARRAFRVKHNEISFGNGNTISFEKKASIAAESDIGGAYIEVKSDALSQSGDYYYGTLYIGGVKNDIIGEIVMDYSYGLQVNVQFIGMDIKGDGSEEKPFQVSAPKHFAVVRALRNMHYIQTANIDLAPQYSYSDDVLNPLWADGYGFEPIGTKDAPFVGSYDGQRNLITNLYISRGSTDNVGLFGYVKGTSEESFAELKNIHIEIAGKMDVCYNSSDLSDVTPVYGNVTGKNNVGGLAGYASNAIITNCSVVKGNVIGSNAVGGLVGKAEAGSLESCFTSTTSLAHYDLGNPIPSSKAAGALVGIANGSLSITKSFTFGLAALDVDSSYKYGTVGGFVGYAESGAALTIDNAFVGANTSDSLGNQSGSVYYRGLTVGSAASNAVKISNTVISAASEAGEADNRVLNPVLGTANGANVGENVVFDSGLNGNLANRSAGEKQALSDIDSGFTVGDLELGVSDDEYTAAYVELASLEISVSDAEISDRSSTYQSGGLFYPVTVTGSGLNITSSVIDFEDKAGSYPEYMDTQLYGNGENKSTDLLFKTEGESTTVLTNIYDMSVGSNNPVGKYTGKVYDNGELFYSYYLPYFTVTKTAGIYELYRKVTYPVQTRYEDGGRLYPIATERQLNALARFESDAECAFNKFSPENNYALITDIALGDYEFKPITGFTGVFNGKNHTVSNIKINQPTADKGVGFFAELSTGMVKNLNLAVDSVSGNNYVGGLVGYIGLNGTDSSAVVISGCSVTQAEQGSGISGNNYVGGLVGYANAGIGTALDEANPDKLVSIYRSHTDVNVSGTNVVGGLAGYSEMNIDNSYSTGDVNGKINATDFSDAPRGIGGLVGVLANKQLSSATQITNSFSSSAVDVSEVTGYNNSGNGVGGLVGNVAEGTVISTVFSSGSVRYCYGDNVDINTLVAVDISTLVDDENKLALGIGGLVGVLNSETTDVYSSASVAANVGPLVDESVVGIGGVAGIANVSLQSAYSSGSTLGDTATADPSGYNYGVGGVIGLVSSSAAQANNLYFDKNVSAVSEDPIGKNTGDGSGITNIKSITTKEFTFAEIKEGEVGFLGGNFLYTDGAYPYLSNFFAQDVSLEISLNALLSIVAIQLNELDESAARGDGISMAMTIPTGVTHNGVTYTYGFIADNSFGDSATSIVDEATNTLSVQRTSNDNEQANFIITIETVNGNASTADGVEYSSIASRPLSRVCAQMLGTQGYPYLVASQEDLSHVAMSEDELSTVPSDSLYVQWNTPNDESTDGKVYYRMMGYITLNDSFAHSFSSLKNGYSFDGNGYSVRNLSGTLAETLEPSSVITNVTFENTAFESGESLVGTVNGSVIGVNVLGSAKGSNVAGIAQTVGENGLIKGSVASLDYDDANGSNIAGLALTNNGTVEMSVGAGNISGSELNNVAGLVLENNGTIRSSFTLGDIILNAPSGVVAGFVGTNKGNIDACYTRCNFKVTDADTSALTIGSFAGSNSENCGISASFAAGLFDVRNAENSAADLHSIFIGSNNGTLTDCMFDKQLSGTCFKDIFALAESTKSITEMSNPALVKVDENKVNVGKYTPAKADKVEYPQLTEILNTKKPRDAEPSAETTQSRMYRTLRSYSALSSATAMIAGDNYTDNLAQGSVTPLGYDSLVSWSLAEGSVGSTGALGVDMGPAYTAPAANGTATAVATAKIEDYHYFGSASKLSDTLNLYLAVNGEGTNPNFNGGNGSEATPYKISTKEQVVALSYYGKNKDNRFIVINDIDMTDTDWNAYIDTFKSTLDGQGYTLYDITIADTNNALIGTLDGGKISNLGLTGISVTTNTARASGLLAASAINGATVTNTVVVGELNAPTGTHAGGLIGDTDDATVINGCIVSGKLSSGATSVGGLVGLATDGTSISNCLSTIFADGGANSVVGGILGGGNATVENSIFAGNVKGQTVGNIAGDISDVTVTNCYFDKQLSSVDGGAEASSTHYLTQGASSTFGSDGSVSSVMTWIPDNDGYAEQTHFVGYPVPTYFTTVGGKLMNAVKLASAAVTFATGIGAGSATGFTTAVPTALDSAELGVSGAASAYISSDGGKWSADTSNMALGEAYGGELTYTLDGMTRYIDIIVGKVVKTVNYTITGLENGGNSILSVVTGKGDSATAATAFDSVQQGVLCRDMVFSYEVVEGKAELFRVETQLPNGYKQGKVMAVFKNGEAVVETVEVETGENGVANIAIPVNEEKFFNTIDITVEAASDDTWGIRGLFGLFR